MTLTAVMMPTSSRKIFGTSVAKKSAAIPMRVAGERWNTREPVSEHLQVHIQQDPQGRYTGDFRKQGRVDGPPAAAVLLDLRLLLQEADGTSSDIHDTPF